MRSNPADIPAQLILDPSLPIPKGFSRAMMKRLADLREAYQWSIGRMFEKTKSLSDPADVAALLIPLMAPLHKEHLVIVPVNSKIQATVAPLPVSVGDVDGVDAGPRNILRSVLTCGAVGFFLAHNHPSGDVAPSAADRAVTSRLAQGARAVDLQFYDHLIIAPPNNWFSLRGSDPSLFR
jgi:DNA repair protein RadC